MPYYLRSAFIKLERANRRIDGLEGEIDTFLNEEANATLGYEDPEEAAAFRRQHDSRDVPLRFSVTAGEVLYHVRSSLDHLACDLIRRNGGGVTPQSQFPVFTFKPT